MISMAELRQMRLKPHLMAGILAALLLPAGAPVRAQTAIEQLANYQGADRGQRLVDGAKREGEIVFYSTLPQDDNAVLAAAFEKKYGVKVTVWRTDSESLLQRIVQESRGKRYEVDVSFSSGSALEPLEREQLLQPVTSPHQANLIAGAVPAHRAYASIYLNTFVQAYNTNLVKKESLPKSFHDLLDPQWKGKLGVEADDFDWFAEIVKSLGEEPGLKLFRDIVAVNGISVRKGHSLLGNLVAAGEVPLALTVYGYYADQLKKLKGAPVDSLTLAPAVARPTAAGIARNPKHPHAALLFYDFLISDALPILVERDFVTTGKNDPSDFTKGPHKIIDSGAMLDEAKKWQDLWQSVVIKPGR